MHVSVTLCLDVMKRSCFGFTALHSGILFLRTMNHSGCGNEIVSAPRNSKPRMCIALVLLTVYQPREPLVNMRSFFDTKSFVLKQTVAPFCIIKTNIFYHLVREDRWCANRKKSSCQVTFNHLHDGMPVFRGFKCFAGLKIFCGWHYDTTQRSTWLSLLWPAKEGS